MPKIRNYILAATTWDAQNWILKTQRNPGEYRIILSTKDLSKVKNINIFILEGWNIRDDANIVFSKIISLERAKWATIEMVEEW